MSAWDGIKQKVEESGNVASVTMEELRNAHGVAKLGVNVRGDISKALAGMGLGHIPTKLPKYQHEMVRLYKRGTPVGELIETVLNPGEENDKKLHERLGGDDPDYAEMINQIREIVAE